MIRNAATKAETSTVSVGPSSLGSVVENSSSSNISPAAPTVTLTTRDLQEFTVDAEIVRLFGIKAPEPKSTIITQYHHHHHHPFYRKRLFNDFLMDDASDGFPGVSLVSEEEEEEEEEELNQPQPSLPNISGPAFAVALSWAKHHLSRPKQLQASTMAYRLVEHRDAGPRVATGSGPGSASGGGSLHYLANRLFPVDLWDVQFVSGLSGEQLQMLLEAANYLNMGWLLDRQCQVAVRKMTEGGRDFVRDTAEEEANLLKVARECSFDTSAAAAARRVNNNSNNSTGNGNGNGNVANNGNKCQKVAAGVDVKGKNTNMSTNRNTNTSTSTSIASTGNLAASFSKRLQMMSKGRVAGGKEKLAVISKSSATSSSSNTIVDVPAIATAAAAAPVQRATIAAKSG